MGWSEMCRLYDCIVGTKCVSGSEWRDGMSQLGKRNIKCVRQFLELAGFSETIFFVAVPLVEEELDGNYGRSDGLG